MAGYSEKIDYASKTKQLIAEALNKLNLNVTSNDSFRSYVDKLTEYLNGAGDIPSGDVILPGIKGLSSEDISSADTSQLNWTCVVDGSSIDWTNVNTLRSNQTSLSSYFEGYQGKYLKLEGFNTSKVTSLSSAFKNCSNLASIDLSCLDLSKVTYVTNMFQGCSSLKNINLGNIDFSKTNSIYYMFAGASSLETIDVSNIDTSNLSGSGIQYAFSGCKSLKEIRGITSWNITNKITSVSCIFENCENLESLDLSGWDTSKAAGMQNTFMNCDKLHTLNLSGWDTSSAYSVSQFIYGCDSLVNLTLAPNWFSHSSARSLDLAYSPLSKESIQDLAIKLADKSSTSHGTVTLKRSQRSLFTEEELTDLVAQFTAKNWTLSWW